MALSTDDVLAIQKVAALYNHAVDAGDGPGFAATFVEDGKLINTERVEGRAALSAFAETVPTRLPRPRHILSNVVIDGDGDRATLKGYLQVFAHIGDGAPQPVTTGVYNDTLRREDGEWLFVERVYVAD